ENGQTSFDFYTADEPGTYRITLEGVDASGRIARSVNHIYVNVQAGENPERRDSVSAYFQERLDAYWSEHPAGNLYLHLDKHHYAPRETVWLKAYVLSDTAADNRGTICTAGRRTPE